MIFFLKKNSVTKPGGWIEFVEPGLVPTNMGPKFAILMNSCK
jgi:hypothetical protein